MGTGLNSVPKSAVFMLPSAVCTPFHCSYALGMIMWCLLTGRAQAWMDASGKVRGTQASLGLRVLRGERPECGSALRDDAPAALVSLMEQCWAQDPAVRPTAAGVAASLEMLMQSPR